MQASAHPKKTAVMYDFDDTLTEVFSLGEGKANNAFTKACSDNWDDDKKAFKEGTCSDEDVLKNLKKGARESIATNIKVDNPVAIITRNYMQSMIEHYMKVAVNDDAKQIQYMTWCQSPLDKLIAAMMFVASHPNCTDALFIDDDIMNAEAISFAKSWFESRGIKLRVIHAEKRLGSNAHLVDTENPSLEYRTNDIMTSNNGSFPSTMEILLGYQRKRSHEKLTTEALFLQTALLSAEKHLEIERKSAAPGIVDISTKIDSLRSFIHNNIKELIQIAPQWFPSYINHPNFKPESITIEATQDPMVCKVYISFISWKRYFTRCSFMLPQSILLAFAECALRNDCALQDAKAQPTFNSTANIVASALGYQPQLPQKSTAVVVEAKAAGASQLAATVDVNSETPSDMQALVVKSDQQISIRSAPV